MALLLASLVLGAALGQASPLGEEPPPRDEAMPSGTSGTFTDQSLGGPPATAEVAGAPGIPYIPSVGVPAGTRGFFLDVGLDSAVRMQTLSTSASETTWGTYLEIVPGLAFQLDSPAFALSVGYAPRLTIPVAVADPGVAFLNRATLQATWQFDPLWSIAVAGRFVVGDYSQLLPSTIPGGPGPPPATIDPVRTFQTYPAVDIDTLVRIEGTLSPRSRIWISGGYFDQGGIGPEGQAYQPRAWGPRGDLGYSFDSSRTTRWTTAATGQNWMLSDPSESCGIATVTQAWTERWSSVVETSLSAGVGVANRDVESATAAGHVVPVARASLGVRSESRQPFSLAVDVALGPYYDTYIRIPYQRLTGGLTLGWQPSEAWSLSASFSGALVPYTVKAPESYGTAGLSVSFAPTRILILTLGGFNQSQFQGQAATTGAFHQWNIFLSVSLRDRISL